MPTGWRYKDPAEPRPACPACGCRDAQIMARPTAGGPVPNGVALCLNCRKVFKFRDEQPEDSAAAGEFGDLASYAHDGEGPAPYRVVLRRLRCPNCQSTDFHTDTTRPETPEGSILRYHVCRKCNNRFSSIER